MTEIQGIDLRVLGAPIRESLAPYQEMNDGLLDINGNLSVDLQLRQDPASKLPSSVASAESNVYSSRGRELGVLSILALGNGGGTGSKSDFAKTGLNFAGKYPVDSSIFPIKRNHIGEEILMPLFTIATPESEPELFAGTYELLGLRPGRDLITKIADIGQIPKDPDEDAGYEPMATNTIAPHYEPVTTLATTDANNLEDERFGEFSSIYNSNDALGVFAVFTVSKDVIADHPGLLAEMHAQMPRRITYDTFPITR